MSFSRKRKRVSTESKTAAQPRAKRAKKDVFYFQGKAFPRHGIERAWLRDRVIYVAHRSVKGTVEEWRRVEQKTRAGKAAKDDNALAAPGRAFYASGRIARIGGRNDQEDSIVPRLTFGDSEDGQLLDWTPFDEPRGRDGVELTRLSVLGTSWMTADWAVTTPQFRLTFRLDGMGVRPAKFKEHEECIVEMLATASAFAPSLCKLVLSYMWFDWHQRESKEAEDGFQHLHQAVDLLRAPLLAECQRPRLPLPPQPLREEEEDSDDSDGDYRST